MKFTLGAGLIVLSVLLLLGAGVTALALAIGERPESTEALASLIAYLSCAALSAWCGFRVLRSGGASEGAERR